MNCGPAIHKMQMRLTEVDPANWTHKGYLYGVLAARLEEPKSNISHKQLPTWEQHEAFLEGKPYLGHYLIQLHMGHSWVTIGCCYVSQKREIGLYIQPGERQYGYGTRALRELFDLFGPKPYFANIAPKNKGSLEFFTGQGFTELSRDHDQVVMCLDA